VGDKSVEFAGRLLAYDPAAAVTWAAAAPVPYLYLATVFERISETTKVGWSRLTLSNPRSKLKAPRIQLLKLKCDEPLSNFAFKLNLRRFTKRLEISALLTNAFRTILVSSPNDLLAAVYLAGPYHRALLPSPIQ